MLTPVFELQQDDNSITILIKAPFAKVSETEIFIEECDFKFYSKPYYLRLNLPCPLVENGQEAAKYDTDTGYFTVIVPKAQKGQHFQGLDLLTQLLAPKGQKTACSPSIELLGPTEEANGSNDEDEDFDWQIEQLACEEVEEANTLLAPKYGFANQHQGVFSKLQAELHGILDLPDADSVPTSGRKTLRVAEEDDQFDEDHYLADLYQNDMIEELVAYIPQWDHEYTQVKAGKSDHSVVEFSEAEKEVMRQLPRKKYLLDKTEMQQALLGLVDIIFAYAYNQRTLLGENTVESAWTICKLSATLSWLQTYSSVKDVAVTCMRRSLCYGLYRHWSLSQRVWKDVRKIFSIGQRRILRCLLEVRSLLMEADPRYVLNDLYITHYCVWIQTTGYKQLQSLARKLCETKVLKSEVDFDLKLLERAALLAIEEDNLANEVSDNLSTLSLAKCNENPDSSVDSVTQAIKSISVESESTSPASKCILEGTTCYKCSVETCEDSKVKEDDKISDQGISVKDVDIHHSKLNVSESEIKRTESICKSCEKLDTVINKNTGCKRCDTSSGTSDSSNNSSMSDTSDSSTEDESSYSTDSSEEDSPASPATPASPQSAGAPIIKENSSDSLVVGNKIIQDIVDVEEPIITELVDRGDTSVEQVNLLSIVNQEHAAEMNVQTSCDSKKDSSSLNF